MELLVPGSIGLVISHVTRQWVARGDDYRVISVDVFPPDLALLNFT
jgi:hypothetical protein